MLLPDEAFGTRDPFFLPALIEVHQTLYGGVGDDSHLTGIPSEDAIRSVVERCYEVDAVYENPLLSFASRPAITDAFLLSRFVSSLCVPGLSLSAVCSPTRWLKGAAHLVRASLGRSSPAADQSASSSDSSGHWKVANVWSECGDIAESHSFDGVVVGLLDHTLHVQLVPALSFLHGQQPEPPTAPSTPFLGRPTSALPKRPAPPPSSLFHIQLRMLSVFQFNEAGRIIFQRDHWDLRDLVESVVPGAGFVGAVGRWAGGLALRLAGRAVGGCGSDGRLWEQRQYVDLSEAAAKGAFYDRSGAFTPSATAKPLDGEMAGPDSDDAKGLGGTGLDTSSIPSNVLFATGSAPMTSLASSTGGTTSPLSPTLQLRHFSSATATAAGLGGLASPTLTASLLLATQQSPPTRTRPRRGTSSRSWGSASARTAGILLPPSSSAALLDGSSSSGGQTDALARALPSAEDLRGMLGLRLDQSTYDGLAGGHGLDRADEDAGRALDHAP